MENPHRFSKFFALPDASTLWRITIFRVCVFLFLCFIASMLICFYAVQANKNHKINGFAWSENLGWVSLNCYNDGLLNKCASSDYGLDYDKASGEVYGFAWAEHGGWLCFGKSCVDADQKIAPDGKAPTARIMDHGLLSGWANFVALGNKGWMKLDGAKAPSVGKKYSCQNCVRLKGEASERCEFCFSDSHFSGSKEICSDCSVCDVVTETCTKCVDCQAFGIGIDYSRNRLSGWTWNADSPNGVGLGWLQFASNFNIGAVHPPYLQTVGGDVYGQKGIGALSQGAAPVAQFNATYRIESNGSIVHFSSACATPGQCDTDSGWIDDKVNLTLPKKENDYRGDIGALDLRGLFAGQYGTVKKIATSGAGLENPLAGKVYYSSADLHIGYQNFKNGIDKVNGAGTIVVKGDLYLDGNVFYQSMPAATLRHLASLGWIVLKKDNGAGGNIFIAPTVENLAGDFYAENKIYTGTTGQADTEKSLRVDGLMIARQFEFQRIYSDLENGGPAELVVYDGRVVANPPPGFTDLTKALPDFK